MKQSLKIVGIILGVLLVLFGAWFVNNLVYPFRADSPNYSDVEKAFTKLQFPSDWKEISSSENRGLHGRGCNPFNDTGCFSKAKNFTVPVNTSDQDIKRMLLSAGCPGVGVTDITAQNDVKKSYRFDCSIGGGLSFAVDLIGPDSTSYVSSRSF